MKLLMASLFLCSLAYGQETIELVDPSTDASAGSFALRDGEICSIAGKEYKVQVVNSATIKRLKETILASGNFDDAGLPDYVAFLNHKSRELSKDGIPIQFILKSFADTAGIHFGMNVRNVTYYDFLQTLCFKAGYTYQIVGNNIHLSRKQGTLKAAANENLEKVMFDSYSLDGEIPILKFVFADRGETAELKIGDFINGYRIRLFRRIAYYSENRRDGPEPYPYDASEVVLVKKEDKSTITLERKKPISMKRSD